MEKPPSNSSSNNDAVQLRHFIKESSSLTGKSVLHTLTQELVRILKNVLPKESGKWWDERVFNKLTFQQQACARERKIHMLEQLDLAALLRVVDQNWDDISEKLNIPRDARSWLKETQGIRNRYAAGRVRGVYGNTPSESSGYARSTRNRHQVARGIGNLPDYGTKLFPR